jgi:hypothetical protein
MGGECRRVEKFHSEGLCNCYRLPIIIIKSSACCLNLLTYLINLAEQGIYIVLFSKIFSSIRIFNVVSLGSYAFSVQFCCNVDFPL